MQETARTEWSSLKDALVAGDEKAITWLYQHCGPVLFTVCRRYAGKEEMAEDLFHDGFLHILAQMKKYRGESAIQTWAYRVMANFCINRLRKTSKKLEWEELADTEIEDDAAYEEVNMVDIEKLLEYMQQMPVRYRLVLNMYALENRAHNEIAEELGISVNTSKSQLFKARLWLKNKLKGGPYGKGK